MAGGTETITRQTEIINASLDKHVKSLIDMKNLPTRLLDNMVREDWDGGEKIVQPVLLDQDRHSETTELISGLEEINLDTRPLLDRVEDGWHYAVRPAAISGFEEKKTANTMQKIVDLLETRMTDCWRGMHTEHQDQIVFGGQTGWSAYNTLNGVDFTGANGGFLEAAAPGAQSNTIHGKSRASFTGALHFQNHFQNLGGAFSTNALLALSQMELDIEDLYKEAIRSGGSVGKPMLYASKNFLKFLKKVTEANVQYTGEGDRNPGGRVLKYGFWDIELLSLPQSGTNTTANPVSAIVLDHEACKIFKHPKCYYDFTELYDLRPHFDIKVKLLSVMSQLIMPVAGTSGIITNGEVY